MRHLSVLLVVIVLSLASSANAEESPLLLAAEAIQPQMAIADDGYIYAVFIHNGNICVSTSSDRGKSFSPPVVAIDGKGKASGGMHRGPRIGVDARKNLTITCPLVCDEGERRKRYPTAELVLVSSRDGGRTWSPPKQVNEVAKQAPEALHWMTVAPSGEVHIAWLDRRERTEPGQDIYYARCIDGSIGKNQKIASLVCECCAPGLTLDTAENPIVAFREGGIKPSREIYAVRSTDKGEHFGKPQQINQAPTQEKGCPMSAPAIAVSKDGKQFAAAWKDMRTGQPQIQWTKSETPTFTADAPVHAQGSGRQDHPSMASSTDGTIWIAWEEKVGGSQQIWVRSSAVGDHGRVLSNLSDGSASFPTVAGNAGLIGVAYEAKKNGKSAVLFRVIKR